MNGNYVHESAVANMQFHYFNLVPIMSVTRNVCNSPHNICSIKSLVFIGAVLLQLFHSLPQNAVQMVYFCLSFGYVLLRVVSVSLSAASINEQSSQVRNILYSVPATSFSTEVCQ